MSLLEDAQSMRDWVPTYYDGLSRKVRDGITGWERYCCVFCQAETLKGYHQEIQHEPGCLWLNMPRIVAVLEAADVLLVCSPVEEEPEPGFRLVCTVCWNALSAALRGDA